MAVIIGCGTGRSGTLTLARILDACMGVDCTHEHDPLLPWNPDPQAYADRLDWLRQGHADVASSYLPYLACLLIDEPDARIIVTRRPAAEVARSFETHIDQSGGRRHHWYDHGGDGWELDPVFDPVFPSYDTPDRHEAILRYARDYDAAVDELAAQFPDNFLIVPTDTLGETATQKKIFAFAGIAGRSRRYSPGAHHNHTTDAGAAHCGTVPLLIGTYRKRQFVEACLRSVEKHLHGYGDVIFIDDSGDDKHADWLAQYGKVVSTGKVGYTEAYRELCRTAQGQQAFVMEEDFTLTADVSIPEMSTHLFERPYLAQVALLRNAVFPDEKEHGGVIEALQAKGHVFTEVAGLIEQTATFTCNPSLWRGHVFDLGWPDGPYSEDRKRLHLIDGGYRFAYLPGIRCHHGDNAGTGFDY